MTTTLALVKYYVNLLSLQYNNKPKALATIAAQVTPIIMPQTSVQTLTFAEAPSTGGFVLSYDETPAAAINWNDSASTIESKLQAITELASVTVAGEIADLLVTITFTGVTPPALLLVVDSSTLDVDAPTILEIDETLPIAVENGFNLEGDNLAQGVQLDVLGKYNGVSRNGYGFGTNITLDDTDFISLMRMAIAKNFSGSSLADIQNILHQFFPSEMYVFDYQNMHMSYIISSMVGSQDLIQMFIIQGLLPRPMGVQLTLIIYADNINFFSFRTYELPAYNGTPFNSYVDYHLDWPWLSYQDAIVI